MKIHFDNVSFSSKSGPNTFATRLAKSFFELGHDVTSAGDADVSLVFIEPSGQQLTKRVVQRLDGIWFKPEEFLPKNKRILQLYETADSVIWQSEFDKNMTVKWWGDPKSGTVIHNGIEKPQINQISEPLYRIRSSFKHVFVSSANWHPQKRLRSNIEMFFHLRNTVCNDSCLIVMGSSPDVFVPSPFVMYTHSMSHENCNQVYSIADWMIHLAWLDHCPNVVVEALSMGVPVICPTSGGTKELVKNYGLVINERDEYGFDLVDYDNPPNIDVSQVTQLPSRNDLGPRPSLDIKAVAQKYVDVFESIA